MTETHTPLPWRAGDFEVFGADDSVVCTVHWRSGDDCHEGNLETIVHAVNSHHDLIEALRDMLDAFIANKRAGGFTDQTIERFQVVTKARAILTKEAGRG